MAVRDILFYPENEIALREKREYIQKVNRHARRLINDLKDTLNEHQEGIGLPEIRFHDLRHTAASLMLNHGVPVIFVSRRLGHSRPSITLDVYGHLISSMQDEVAGLMDDIVTPLVVAGCTRTAHKRWEMV